jgi:uncharacterized protein YkwD
VTCPPPRAWNRAGVAVVAALVIGALTACGAPGHAPAKTTSSTGAPRNAAIAARPDTTPSATGAADPSATAGGPGAGAPGGPNPGGPGPAKPKGAPKPVPPLPGVSAAAQAVLEQTNAWRAAAGLRPYVMLPGLNASTHKHNLRMAAGCGLSHKCDGEAAFGDRIHAEGVSWSSAGENCAVGGGVANTTTAVTASAKGLNLAMFKETPPDDGHRRNLLSSSFTHIGIDVVRDSKGNVWLSEDFTS